VSDIRLTAEAAYAVIRRDAMLYLSYRLRLIAQGAAIFFTTVLFYYVSRLVRVEPFTTPDAYFAYVLVGLVILELLTATLSTTPTSLRTELLAGTFERMAVAPLGPRAAIVAMTIFPALLSLAVGTVTLALALVLFDLDLRWTTAPLALPAALLALYAFLPFALAVASLILLVKQASSATVFLVTGLSLTSGAFFPVELLPGWVSWVSDVQPLTPALELLRHLLLGIAVETSPGAAVLKLVAFGSVLLPLSYLLLGEVVATCRRRGTLTEY